MLRLIVVTLMTFLILGGAYESFLRLKPIESTVIVQSHFDKNLGLAERLFFAKEKCRYVILGSSLSYYFSRISLDEGVCNFSFIGSGVRDGLRMLKDMDVYPEVLIFEENVLAREENIELSKIDFTSLKYMLAKYIYSLRVENRFPALILTFAYHMTGRREGKRYVYQKNKADEQIRRAIEMREANYAQENRTEILKSYQDMLSDPRFRSIPKYSFRFPNLDFADDLQQQLHDQFSIRKLDVSLPSFETADGLHPTDGTALKFYKEMMGRLKLFENIH